MNIIVIYNPKSGSEYSLRHIRQLCRAHNIAIDYSFKVTQLGSKRLARLVQSGVVVGVVGGDGTLRSVARLLIGTKSTLLALPGGTFNHFVRDIGVEPTLDAAFAQVHSMRRRAIDTAEVNGELFLNNSNLGLYPFSLIERKTTKKILGKWIAAALSMMDQLGLFRRHALIIDGKPIRSPFIFVGNNSFDISRSLIPQRTEFNKGVLCVMISTAKTRRNLIATVLAVMRGTVTKRDDFSMSHRGELIIDSNRATIPVSLDGEVKRLSPPLKYLSRPKSLNVMIPER